MVLSCSTTQIVLPSKQKIHALKKQQNVSLIPIKLNMWQYIISNIIYNFFFNELDFCKRQLKFQLLDNLIIVDKHLLPMPTRHFGQNRHDPLYHVNSSMWIWPSCYFVVVGNDWFFFIGTLAYWGIQFEKYCAIKNTCKIVLLYHAL
jgi:hypothetical protein